MQKSGNYLATSIGAAEAARGDMVTKKYPKKIWRYPR